MSTSNGDMQNVPPLVRSIILLGSSGCLAGVTLYLVYQLAGNVTAASAETLKRANDTAIVFNVHADELRTHASNSNVNQATMERYLRMICVNTAKTEQDRRNCTAGY